MQDLHKERVADRNEAIEDGLAEWMGEALPPNVQLEKELRDLLAVHQDLVDAQDAGHFGIEAIAAAAARVGESFADDLKEAAGKALGRHA